MTRHLKVAFALTVLAAIATSCSIKEDRGPCPCWLDVVVSGCAGITNTLTLSAWGADALFCEDIDIRDHPDCFERTVPKGMLSVCAHLSGGNTSLEDGALLLQYGIPCDSIFTHHAAVDCTGEFARDSVILRKQFATVYLTIVNLAEGELYPYDLSVRSAFDGIGITDGVPHPGGWSCPLVALSDRSYAFRVPRQGDGSLVLDLYLDGDLVDTYPIGTHILKAGYSWDEEDLRDIRIGMDYGQSEPRIIIEPWEEGPVYDEII